MSLGILGGSWTAHAQVDGNWVPTTGGNWADPAKWSSNPLIPGGVGSTVGIESNIATATSIDLESTDRTVGILNIGDATGSSSFEIKSSGTGSLIFNRAGGAQINMNQGGGNSITAPVVLNSDLGINNNLSSSTSLVFGNNGGSKVISGSGGITQGGTGRAFYWVANTFSGGYTLNSGRVGWFSQGGWGSGPVTINGGTIDVSVAINITDANIGGDFSKIGSNILTFSGTPTLTANSVINATGRVDFSGGLTGAFSLTKEGAELMNFYNAVKTYSGGFTLNEGTVLAQVDSAFGTGTLRLNGGAVSAASGTRTYSNALEFGGAVALGDTSFGNGGMTFSGNGTLLADTTLEVVTSGGAELRGDISGNFNLIKTGAHALTLAGVNKSYTGYTEVQAGALRLFRLGNVLPSSSEVRVTGGTLEVVAFDQTIGSLQVSSGTITDNDGLRTLTANSFSFTDSGTVDTRLAGAGALDKSGAGTVSLNRANGNTYSGGTLVNAGTLLVNNTSGSGTGSGDVTVAASAVLGGDGIITGATTISGSLRPGNSIGTLTVSNDVTWNAGDAWVFELGTAAASLALAESGGSTQDQLLISGGGSDFLQGSGSAWTFDFDGGGEQGWYQLVNWDGTTDFVAGDFTASNLASGLSGNFVVDGTSSALFLEVIPEPSSGALIGIGLGWILLRLRRRR